MAEINKKLINELISSLPSHEEAKAMMPISPEASPVGDELVARLRAISGHDECGEELTEAADRIEALQARINSVRGIYAAWEREEAEAIDVIEAVGKALSDGGVEG